MTGWTEEGLLRSWRALAKQQESSDWQLVHLTDVGAIAVEAGCHFPGSREAVVVSFPRMALPGAGGLPEGNGFDVVSVGDEHLFGDRTAIALVRRAEGSLDIFTVMTTDVLRFLHAADTTSSRELAQLFVRRVEDWQTFMARNRRPLSPEKQLGLMGELWFLEQLRLTNLSCAAVDCWQGPLHALQDFYIGGGTVEVKSSLAGGTFLAKINSIEQLDTEKTPAFLAALRFEVADDGTDLVGIVAHLRKCMAAAGLLRAFEALLLVSGYQEDHAEHYRRKLRLVDGRAYAIDDGFPCLRRATVPAQIRRAVYSLDVDALGLPTLTIDEILSTFGLIKNEP